MDHAAQKNDDVTILDEDALLRRIPNWPDMVRRDQVSGQYRPTSASFADRDTGDREISVTHEANLLAANCTHMDALNGNQEFGLASIHAGFPRKQISTPQAIARDPIDSDPHHCLIIGNKSKADKRALAKQCALIIIPKNLPNGE
jgi:hypothetical protein